MDNSLKKLNKKELINIISKMKKNDLINIINNKIGGTNEIIKETKDAVRKPIIYDSKKNKKNYNNAMANDPLYNKIYEIKNN